MNRPAASPASRPLRHRSAALLVALEPRTLLASTYTLLDLGTTPSGTGPRSLSDHYYAGSQLVSNLESAYYAAPGGTRTKLNAVSGYNSTTAWDLNAGGTVVGASYPSNNRSNARATLWSNGNAKDLGLGEARAVNKAGVAVGIANNQAVLYSNGTVTSLGSLGGIGSVSYANDISDANRIVGRSNGRAFVYTGGDLFDLSEQAGGTSGEAFAVNNGGTIVGQINNRAFVTTGLNPSTLPALNVSGANGTSTARDINERGQIVGSTGVSGRTVATLWEGNAAHNLSSLVVNLGDWRLDAAVSIADNGRIIVYGQDGDGESHALLLTPGGSTLSGKGALSVVGTPGEDTVTLSVKSNRLRVSVNGVTQTFTPSKVKKISVYTYAANDTVTVGSGVIGLGVDAGDGNDTVSGGAGSDYLVGGAGNDRLTGNDAYDTLVGGAGNDTLTGNVGRDLLDGGPGSDRSDNDRRDKRSSIEVLL